MRVSPVPAIAATLALLGIAPASPAAASPAMAAASSAAIPLLRVGTLFSIPTLDPTKATYAGDVDQLSLETLQQYGPDGQLEPELATSVTQPNPVTYVYHLRHGVDFWDGSELTSADVVYSWDYERAPGAEGSYLFASVKNITADGPFTVVVTLAHPDASWQYTPTFENIFEMKFAEAHKGTFGKPGVLVMGTGPWEVDSLDPTTGAELSANPHWWGGAVPIQDISVRIFATETSLELAMRAGEIDLDTLILDPKSFEATSGAKMLTAPSDNFGQFSMNTQMAPWNDVHVRRAVAYALDRPNIIAANGGYATPIYTLVTYQQLRTIASSSQINGLFDSLNLYPYDLAKAKAEMAGSAYPHGFSTTLFEYSYGSSVDISEVVAAALAKIGIHAQVKVTPTLSAWAAAETGPADKRPTNFSTGGGGVPDPSSNMAYLGTVNEKEGAWNMADYSPPGLDGLINEGVATTNAAKRFAVYSDILRQLATDVPYVPLYLNDLNVALSQKFTIPGFNSYSMSGDYALTVKAAQ